MCGRFVGARSAAELAHAFDIDRVATDDETLPADYNVAPTKRVHVVLERHTDDAGETERQLRDLRWGLVPPWADSLKIGSRLINARAETAATKPAFRRALAARRCLVPADGYFEWGVDEYGRRQPYFIHSSEAGLALAGLYERWRDPERDDEDPDAWVWTFTILTTAASSELSWLHHRMPLVMPPDWQAAWLDPTHSRPGRLHDLVAAGPRLRAYPVSTEVNSPHNNGAHLLRPQAATTQ